MIELKSTPEKPRCPRCGRISRITLYVGYIEFQGESPTAHRCENKTCRGEKDFIYWKGRTYKNIADIKNSPWSSENNQENIPREGRIVEAPYIPLYKVDEEIAKVYAKTKINPKFYGEGKIVIEDSK